MTDAVQLAKSVLVAESEPFVTLSLAEGLPPVTADTTVADARRNYMRIAGAIHPDRLQDSFDRATDAFQCLVRAFECFADPKSRKKAATAALKKARAGTATAAAKVKATLKTKLSSAAAAPAAGATAPKQKTARKAEKPPKKQPKKGKRQKAAPESDEEEASESEVESEGEEASAAEEDAWEEWAAADAEPEVSTSRTPIGQPRVGGLYQQTTVGCPKCRSLWEPDSRPQYSLFMGHWGKRVHCQLCLFEFGCATALHNCPHCSAAFDYDVSMYDAVQSCKRCKKQFGFPYYPVNQHLIDQIALEEWKERKDREKAAEREARARARHGTRGNVDDDSAESEKTQLLVGTCVMDEECPLCHARVKSKHRSHVLECLAKSPEERAAAPAAGKKSKQTKAKPKTAIQKPTPKAVAAKKAPPKTSKAKAPPTHRKRRRGDSDSDDSDSDASLSESDDEDISSESSFSGDDDDDYDDSD
ncbi:hypothetical protein ABL78_2005 [Leptomonas seymouri]|uniref:J domain-containing protein n=1 Tax=Leptomonas seymouri TaxID=5684 RepID=A0A0N1I853_LEPSE|nr:hypothetical protein ABL78_2005 [Leptomonas seymouri]|eukprot:KPI88888.1 hypothetical protein ABL78_2005 [Leptomonas seymouri]